MHDVDEDMRTVTYQGSRWPDIDNAGMMRRNMNNKLDHYTDHVASVKKNKRLAAHQRTASLLYLF